MSSITKAEKQSSNCKVQSKSPNLILIFMLVRSLQKANAEQKHLRSWCIVASEHEKELEVHQTAALGRVRENISKHVKFY